MQQPRRELRVGQFERGCGVGDAEEILRPAEGRAGRGGEAGELKVPGLHSLERGVQRCTIANVVVGDTSGLKFLRGLASVST